MLVFPGERCRNEVMREDAHEDKSEVGPRHALMQTYVDDPIPQGQDNAPAASGTSGEESGKGSGLPQVV